MTKEIDRQTLERAKDFLLRRVSEKGTLCISRISMESAFGTNELMQAADELLAAGKIREVLSDLPRCYGAV